MRPAVLPACLHVVPSLKRRAVPSPPRLVRISGIRAPPTLCHTVFCYSPHPPAGDAKHRAHARAARDSPAGIAHQHHTRLAWHLISSRVPSRRIASRRARPAAGIRTKQKPYVVASLRRLWRLFPGPAIRRGRPLPGPTRRAIDRLAINGPIGPNIRL